MRTYKYLGTNVSDCVCYLLDQHIETDNGCYLNKIVNGQINHSEKKNRK